MRSILPLSFLFWCFAPLIVLAKPDTPESDGANIEITEADAWGNLSLRLVYDGDPPPPRALPVPPPLLVTDETLVVNAKDRGVANVCIYLDTPRGGSAIPVHPSYQGAANATVVLAASPGRFDPHVVFLRTTQTLEFSNADLVAHNLRVDMRSNAAFSVHLDGRTHSKALAKPEAAPGKIECCIHPWMEAYLLVRDNPYAAISDKSGKISIANLPVGKHTFIVWHESVGFIRAANISGRDTELPRGRWELEIKPGDNDLGEIKLKPEVFRR